AMVGAYFIPSDPIFNGLAISLIFGLIVSTLLTILVVPLLYYVLARLDLMKKCFATAKAQTRFLG
ncbi:hypothetical protein ACT3TA_18060, partial [Halomonas sp. AOP42-C1-46]|uniref:hypothetical protein n=1 Tax=unclassified Halomonas TaxID=2609666 RepID=UPI0040342BFE